MLRADAVQHVASRVRAEAGAMLFHPGTGQSTWRSNRGLDGDDWPSGAPKRLTRCRSSHVATRKTVPLTAAAAARRCRCQKRSWSLVAHGACW